MSYKKKVKLELIKKKSNIPRRVWGFFLFLTSTLLLPVVFGITYLLNKKYGYTLKQFWTAYIDALKDMLNGTWRNE